MKKSNLESQQIEIGKFITDLRQQQHITQKELADALGTSQSAVARMEKGEQNFSTEMLLKISKILNKDILSLSRGTVSYRVHGGLSLSGTIRVHSSKNSAVGILFASLLNHGKTTLHGIPNIEEIHHILDIFSSIGVQYRWKEQSIEIQRPKSFELSGLDENAIRKTRSSFLLIGALSGGKKEFSFPFPGGRETSSGSELAHLYGLERLGIVCTAEADAYHVVYSHQENAEVVMFESSDTATENVILAAAALPRTTTIRMASANYMVQELCVFLQQLGVAIEGIGTATLVIRGSEAISKNSSYAISEDPIEAMLFLSAAIVTGSEILIERCPIDFLLLELLKLEKMGFSYTCGTVYLAENGYTRLVDIQTHVSKLSALSSKVEPRPYPGINIDNLPFFVPIATQAIGTTLIHDWPSEYRAMYYGELRKLGANVIVADPHRVYITGPTELQSVDMVCPPDFRPAAAIVVAMLAAQGVSTLRNVYTVNRGYDDLVSRLNSIGAKIEILHGIAE